MSENFVRKEVPESVRNVTIPLIQKQDVIAKFKPAYDEVKKKIIELNPSAETAIPWDNIVIRGQWDGISIDLEDNEQYRMTQITVPFKGISMTDFLWSLGFPKEIKRSQIPELKNALNYLGLGFRYEAGFNRDAENDRRPWTDTEFVYMAFSGHSDADGAVLNLPLPEGDAESSFHLVGLSVDNDNDPAIKELMVAYNEHASLFASMPNAINFFVKVYDDAYVDKRTSLDDVIANKPTLTLRDDFMNQ